MRMSIIGQVMADSSEDDTDSSTHEDEHRGLPTVISLTQGQLARIGSDKLPSLLWDPRVHFVGSLFYLMMTQVAPERQILYCGLILTRHAGSFPKEQNSFSLLILMIEHGDGWIDIVST
jgi:hypothetical protein